MPPRIVDARPGPCGGQCSIGADPEHVKLTVETGDGYDWRVGAHRAGRSDRECPLPPPVVDAGSGPGRDDRSIGADPEHVTFTVETGDGGHGRVCTGGTGRSDLGRALPPPDVVGGS